jgi:hypothetical protein
LYQRYTERRHNWRNWRTRSRLVRSLRSFEKISRLPLSHHPIPDILSSLDRNFLRCALLFGTFPSFGHVANTDKAIIAADRASRGFELARDPDRQYKDQNRTATDAYEAQKPTIQRVRDWGNENRYSIVFGSWVASMGIALGIVQRNKYLTGAQKLVQARVYAQGLTVAVLLASFALEGNDAAKGKGRWETIKVLDPNDPTHKHYIEKRIHHERYEGEDQWRGMLSLISTASARRDD